MGIPSYFNFILKHHPTIVKSLKTVHCDYLFVDANSLIYDCIHELKEVNSYDEVYSMVYNKMIALKEQLKPRNKTYFYFDGVPPYAKMVQQRQRRFKSILTKQILQQETKSWNTNHITPGTDFMNGLDDYLIEKFKYNKTIVFSGSQEPMEGEHKICDTIRSHSSIFKDKNIMIYGLDADLIMLGLLLQSEMFRIYLYKETKHFQYIHHIKESEHYVFQMNRLSCEIQSLLNGVSIQQSVYDYIFICFLCGNDFLPHIPAIQIRNNGIQVLLEHYNNLKLHLIDVKTKNIMWNHVSKLFHSLRDKEDELILENINWKLKLKHKIKSTKTIEDKLNNLPCVDTEKEQYLRTHLDEYNKYILETNDVRNHCLDYLKTLEWTWFYYNGDNINNRISYEHHYGPRIQDILLYIPLFNGNEIVKRDKNITPIDPITQLYFVLPYPNHSTVIPRDKYQMTHSFIYKHIPVLMEMNYPFFYTFCKFFWESHLQLSKINIDYLNSCIIHINKINNI